MSEDRIVLPGDEVGAAEEYVCGEGTYELDGKIYAAVPGVLRLDRKEKVAEVRSFNPPTQIRAGDIVIGVVTHLRSSMAELEILEIEGKARTISGNTEASLHVSKVSNRYVEEMGDAYRLGDYVRAKVIQAEPSIQVTTDAPDLGTIKGRCIVCRSPLSKRGHELYCENCERTERRKIASCYSTP
ncbi:MAG: exosome complex RNA-binding protein Csl4 [Candidatus Thermoplasmatota archaeon]